ncbi:MAG TPA: ABC transporter ATP-binding protein [Candidatus Nanopelagicaceae bacterium]|nr:ABC transporter ATP-binding protein [Candidatus Nanopelagicaceae bacterium]
MLSIAGLTTDHGQVRALDDVTFDVPAGSLTAVIGANGAGKTTLLRTVTGLVKPTSGTVRWYSQDLLCLPTEQLVRHGVAHVPEGRSVVAELTVSENLQLGALWRGKDPDVQIARDEVLALFPILSERLGQRADTLSGGERQMLAIARALIARPKLLLLDEPSLGLAPLIVEQIFQTLDRLRKESGLTVVLVEQNAVSALEIADHAVLLSLGQIVVSGSAKLIEKDTQLRHAYLGY